MWGGQEYDREKLYKEVWEEPLIKIAPRYGISDVALRKACVKLKIPLPGVGYWNKVKAGAKIKQPRLPKYNGPPVICYSNPELYEKEQQKRIEKRRDNERAKLEWNKIKKGKRLIKVFEKPTEPHPLAEKWYKRLKQGLSYCNNWMSQFVFFGSEDSANRALCIMDAIIKTLIAEGYTVGISGGSCFIYVWVDIENETIYFGLTEYRMRIPHVKTSEDDYYSFDFLPTGKLQLIIENYSRRRKWMDTSKHKLEDCLSDFIDGLMLAAAYSKIETEKRPERERKRQEEEEQRRILSKQRRVREELRAKEIKKFKILKQDAESWKLAQTIKGYIDEMESTLNDSLSGEELAIRKEYITWAREKISWLNPLENKEDDLIGYRSESYEEFEYLWK